MVEHIRHTYGPTRIAIVNIDIYGAAPRIFLNDQGHVLHQDGRTLYPVAL